MLKFQFLQCFQGKPPANPEFSGYWKSRGRFLRFGGGQLIWNSRMASLTFECVWENFSAPEVALVRELWKKYRALDSDEVMEKRSMQIVYVVKGPDGQVGGVATAAPVRAAFLNNNFFYEFRCFVAPEFRAPGLDSLLTVKTKEFLERLPDGASKFKGILTIVENEDLKKQRTKAVWPASGMVFAGYNSKGDHIRVGYFKGARI